MIAEKRNVLLVNPRFPRIHQNYDYLLPMVEKTFIAPPLSLLTVAACFPSDWDIQVVDENVAPVSDAHLQWAHLVMMTGIDAQSGSLGRLGERCARFAHVTVILGGLHASTYGAELETLADAIVVGEAEHVLPRVLDDYRSDRLEPLYNSERSVCDIRRSPCPRFELADMRDYLLATVQYSRGCPFSCDFCQLTHYYGHVSREKGCDQFLRELTALHTAGFRGTVMLGDDNFHRCPGVGPLCDALLAWQEDHGFPFRFFTQTDIRISEDAALMRRMVRAGFISLQIGIESPCAASLESAHKRSNMGVDLLAAVHAIHRSGLEVLPAMLVGLDGDPDDVFDRQMEFLQRAGTPRCMISLLRPLRGTAVHDAMEKAGRLIGEEALGNQTGDFVLNYEPRMGRERLLAGVVGLIREVFSPRNYFQRCRTFLRMHNRREYRPRPFSWRGARYVWNYARQSKARAFNGHFVLFMIWCLFRRPRRMAMALELGMLGYHYYRMMRRADVGIREQVEGFGVEAYEGVFGGRMERSAGCHDGERGKTD